MRIFFLLLVVVYSMVSPASAQNREQPAILTTTESLNEVDLSPYITSITDTGFRLRFDQVSSTHYDSLFSRYTAADNKDKEHCWARIKIRSEADNMTSWVLKTDKLYSDVTCYIVYPDRKTIVQKSGWMLPPAERSINDPDVIFNILLAGHEDAVIYLHINTDPRWSSLSHVQAKLFSEEEWSRAKWKKFAFLLFYAGICLLATFFWLLTYLYSRRANYLYLIATVLSSCIYFLDNFGVTATFFWSGPWWHFFKYSQVFIWQPFVCLSLLFAISRMNHFREQVPKMNAVLWTMGILTGIKSCKLYINYHAANNGRDTLLFPV